MCWWEMYCTRLLVDACSFSAGMRSLTNIHTHLRIHVQIHMQKQIHIHTTYTRHKCVRSYAHIDASAYMHANTCMYVYIYIYIYTGVCRYSMCAHTRARHLVVWPVLLPPQCGRFRPMSTNMIVASSHNETCKYTSAYV